MPPEKFSIVIFQANRDAHIEEELQGLLFPEVTDPRRSSVEVSFLQTGASAVIASASVLVWFVEDPSTAKRAQDDIQALSTQSQSWRSIRAAVLLYTPNQEAAAESCIAVAKRAWTSKYASIFAYDRNRLGDVGPHLLGLYRIWSERPVTSASLEEAIESSARDSRSTLIIGESGTGKDLVAKRVYRRWCMNLRAEGAFAGWIKNPYDSEQFEAWLRDNWHVINCTSFADMNMARYELDGAMKGAFTGCDRHYEGVLLHAFGFVSVVKDKQKESLDDYLKCLVPRKFMNPKGVKFCKVPTTHLSGTIAIENPRPGVGVFFDEIGEMHPALYPLLNRFLQNDEIRPMKLTTSFVAPRSRGLPWIKTFAATSSPDWAEAARIRLWSRRTPRDRGVPLPEDLFSRLAGYVIRPPSLSADAAQIAAELDDLILGEERDYLHALNREASDLERELALISEFEQNTTDIRSLKHGDRRLEAEAHTKATNLEKRQKTINTKERKLPHKEENALLVDRKSVMALIADARVEWIPGAKKHLVALIQRTVREIRETSARNEPVPALAQYRDISVVVSKCANAVRGHKRWGRPDHKVVSEAVVDECWNHYCTASHKKGGLLALDSGVLSRHVIRLLKWLSGKQNAPLFNEDDLFAEACGKKRPRAELWCLLAYVFDPPGRSYGEGIMKPLLCTEEVTGIGIKNKNRYLNWLLTGQEGKTEKTTWCDVVPELIRRHLRSCFENRELRDTLIQATAQYPIMTGAVEGCDVETFVDALRDSLLARLSEAKQKEAGREG